MTPDTETTRRVYQRGAAAGIGGHAAEVVSRFGQLWLLTALLGREDFGRFALALTIVHLGTLIGASGLQQLVIYRLSRADAAPGELAGRRFAGAVLGWSLIAGGAVAVACHLAAPVAGAVLGDPALVGWLRGLAWLAPASAALMAYSGWHQSRQRMVSAILIGQAAPAVLGVVALVVAWRAGGGRAAVVAATVVPAAAVLAGWWLTNPVNPFRVLGVLGRGDAAFALQVTGNGIVDKVLRHTDVLLLGGLAGPAVVADYTVAMRFARLVRVVHDLLGPVFTPRIGYLLRTGRRAALEHEFHAIRLVSFAAALVVVVPLAGLGPHVLGWFGGYGAAYPVLLLLTGAMLSMVAFGKSGVLLLMTGHAVWSMAITVVLLVLNVWLNIALIPLLGATGAAIATLVSLLAAQVAKAVLIRRLERIRTLPPAMAVVLAMTLAGLGLGAADVVPATVSAAVIGGVLVWLLVRNRSALAAVLPAPGGQPA